MSGTAERQYEAREKRISDAIELKEPDRVPFVALFGFFPAKYAGITCAEAMYDREKMMHAWVKTMKEFEPDAYENPFTIRFLGALLEALDFKQLRWPGHGVSEAASYQFVEGEYMKADEYDAFLFDLSDYMVRCYWPRVFGALQGLGALPPLNELISYYLGLTHLAALDAPEVGDALAALRKAGRAAATLVDAARAYGEEMKSLGIPPQFGAITQAPFDTLSDFFRGTRGAMLDLYRQPEKLLAATEKLLPIMLRSAVRTARRTGVPRVFIPLHKGSDGFMSLEQFKTFFWPGLRTLMLGLIEEGLVPCPFFEGDYGSRLEVIADIPRGKACYAFERTDLLRAKEVLGGRVCLRGNVPLSLLGTGAPEEVKAHCRRLIREVGKGGGFILDAATGLDDARPENVRAMAECARESAVRA
ncbi:MAG: uroporphyrinogen decarboxylase family protein [bacterium]